MLLHHCCGELESVSFSFDHQDACCEISWLYISITAPSCCEDEIIETALNLEGLPHSIIIQFISPLIGMMDNWGPDNN